MTTPHLIKYGEGGDYVQTCVVVHGSDERTARCWLYADDAASPTEAARQSIAEMRVLMHGTQTTARQFMDRRRLEEDGR